ncbi:hypothetical protein TVAG_481330 [Trichomonas vaginalis G3]|uniref:Uncharacterized protein n=1 Tax=Trichomonas vaginalis (strain ATCC PRA-98 / G3) TaxID=412133 RepID=A2F208_TRIV3|nr:hypothetical protein TVAGG3_0477370 [Trichomonas vaginalis G3]EAY01063.1 hypothetical protein TVAG_481330 [Trichomonas vaginalis G3]KAI5515499.1 hypothetical protein TVAGG3_0477370 [Trichomonas vaginalis G3]|eukprot:XP_001313935.1 hypothetical protein [Trichomonas vaginalis G3]
MSEEPAENPQPENTEVEENHNEEEAQAEQTETVENTEPLFETENEKVKPMPQRIVQPVTDSLGDIQHIRSELYAQVQTIQHQQESKFHNLESQLNDMERTIQPEIQKLEHAQEESKQQLNRARDKLNSIQTDELIPLRRQYDQLSSNFDRFVRMDIEAKLKPLQEDIKSSKSKVNELLLSTQTSFSKVDSSLESISAKIEESQNNLKSQQAKINTQFDSYVPKIGALTHKVQLLRDLLQDSPALGSGQTTVSTSLESTKEYITRLTEQVIPQKIQATAVHFDEAHVQLDQYVAQRVEKVKADLEKIKDKNSQVITSWGKTEETIDNLLQTSDATKDSLKNLQDNVKIKLQRLSFEVESSLGGLEARSKDMSTENSNASNSLNTKVEDEISSRRKQVDMSCRRVVDQIRKDYSSAERAQNRAIQRINELEDTLEGEGNIVGKMRDIKMKLNNVVNTIELTNEQRMADKQKGALPINIHNRLAALEARMLAGEERLAKLDGKGAFRNPHKIVPSNEKIDLLPQPAGEGNDLDRALYVNNQSMSVAASASISSRPSEEPKAEEPKPEKEENKAEEEKPEKEENKSEEEKTEAEAEVDVSIKMSEAVDSKSKKQQKKKAEEDDEEEEEKPKKKKKKAPAPKVNEDE